MYLSDFESEVELCSVWGLDRSSSFSIFCDSFDNESI